MQQMVDFLSKYAIKCYKTKGWYKWILELKNYVAFSWFVGAIGVEIVAESCWLWQSIFSAANDVKRSHYEVKTPTPAFNFKEKNNLAYNLHDPYEFGSQYLPNSLKLSSENFLFVQGFSQGSIWLTRI